MGVSVIMILKIFLLISFSILISAQEGTSKARKPKIFYVSTKETSTILTTHTVCYMTSAATTHTQCGRRKRRSLEMIEKLKDLEEIKVSTVDIAKEDKQEEDLLERNPELQGSNERDPRFQIYWLTTTKTFTSTSITGTYSLASINCTPAN